jgi:NTE family protein
MDKQLKIGIALGSGSSRGWSHIGVINALADLGITPTIVCGTSVGSLVGASLVSGKLEKLEEWARSLTKLETARFFDINTSMNGFVNVKKIHNFMNKTVASDDSVIEDLDKVYAAVATELETGRELWLTKGSVGQAVLASMALPGLFPPIKINDKWLVDGGLVNPVPVSVCRALGADIVIAVNLNGDIVGKHMKKQKLENTQDTSVAGKISRLVKDYTGSLFTGTNEDDDTPALLDTLAGSINITQDRITRSRMAGDPPDILLSPKLSQIGLLELYRANEAITEGRKCVQRERSHIEDVFHMN